MTERHDIQETISIKTVSGVFRACIDRFGVSAYAIDTPKGRILFEFSDLFGPLPINKAGMPIDLDPRHPLWLCASLWNVQGRRVEDGVAIWHEPKKPVMQHMGGNRYLVIEPGEVGHDW